MTSLPERMQAFYERLNVEKEGALVELPELYTDDVQFVSPIEERDGINSFKESWANAFKNYKGFSFHDFKRIGDDNSFALFYTMTIDIGVGNPMPTPTATLFVTRGGKVYYQYDYWDTVGGLTTIWPPLNTAYQWAVAKFLGGGKPFESDPDVHIPVQGKDGCYHPTSEDEIVSLVRKTRDLGGKIRVVGTGHSVWESIVPENFDPSTPVNERLLCLDKLARILSFRTDPDNPACVLVEVEAGCHLGEAPRHPVTNVLSPTASRDPRTPNVTQESSWEESLNFALQQRGFALQDLGGISHQTIGGFLSTGSAGGTCKWSFLDAVTAIRVVTGEAKVQVLTPTANAEAFASVGAGLGLNGIISTVTLRAFPTYNIVGVETTSTAKDAPDLDFYGDGDEKRPSLARFLEETDYSRLMWWPQRNFDRLVVWKAKQVAPTPDFKPKPYEEVGSFPIIKQMAASLLYTILGNLDDPHQISAQLQRLQQLGHDFGPAVKSVIDSIKSAPPPDPAFPVVPQEHHPWLHALAQELLGERHPAVTLGSVWTHVAEVLAYMFDTLVSGALASRLLEPLVKLLRWAAPHMIDTILSPFVSPGVQDFQDLWYLGLPMDNGMDDILMPTYFTEIWIPFTQEGGEVKQAISALRTMFDADGSPAGCYKATGPFSIELYATKGGKTFSMDPAYGDKSCFRVDVFWFGYNGGDPVTDFYPQFWKALDGLEYRLHWGKFLPNPDQMAPSKLTSRFEKFEAWKAARKKADPNDVFLTNYWKTHLGL